MIIYSVYAKVRNKNFLTKLFFEMKKLLFMFALMFGMMFVSCGNKAASNSEQNDSTKVEAVTVDTMAVDSVQMDSDSISLDSLHV
mgnify:CR=1 FL=1